MIYGAGVPVPEPGGQGPMDRAPDYFQRISTDTPGTRAALLAAGAALAAFKIAPVLAKLNQRSEVNECSNYIKQSFAGIMWPQGVGSCQQVPGALDGRSWLVY